MAQILKVDDIHVYYGSIHAVKGVSFEVNEGEVVTLIGANGAGKSTILNTISGLLHPKMGSVLFEDKDITDVPPYRRRVRRELADHILSRAELLERSSGCPRGQAIERAISAMGDAHSLGLLLRRTRFPLRGLFLTLMTSLIWAAIAACILYLLLHLGLRT